MQNLFVDASNYTKAEISNIIPGLGIAFVDSVSIVLSAKSKHISFRLFLNIHDKTTYVIAY